MKTLPINQDTIKAIIEEVKIWQQAECKTDQEIRVGLNIHYEDSHLEILYNKGTFEATKMLVRLATELTMRVLELEKEERAFAV